MRGGPRTGDAPVGGLQCKHDYINIVFGNLDAEPESIGGKCELGCLERELEHLIDG